MTHLCDELKKYRMLLEHASIEHKRTSPLLISILHLDVVLVPEKAISQVGKGYQFGEWLYNYISLHQSELPHDSFTLAPNEDSWFVQSVKVNYGAHLLHCNVELWKHRLESIASHIPEVLATQSEWDRAYNEVKIGGSKNPTYGTPLIQKVFPTLLTEDALEKAKTKRLAGWSGIDRTVPEEKLVIEKMTGSPLTEEDLEKMAEIIKNNPYTLPYTYTVPGACVRFEETDEEFRKRLLSSQPMVWDSISGVEPKPKKKMERTNTYWGILSKKTDK